MKSALDGALDALTDMTKQRDEALAELDKVKAELDALRRKIRAGNHSKSSKSSALDTAPNPM